MIFPTWTKDFVLFYMGTYLSCLFLIYSVWLRRGKDRVSHRIPISIALWETNSNSFTSNSRIIVGLILFRLSWLTVCIIEKWVWKSVLLKVEIRTHLWVILLLGYNCKRLLLIAYNRGGSMILTFLRTPPARRQRVCRIHS